MSEPYVYLGPTPCEESCQQVGSDQYDPQLARKECVVWIAQMKVALRASGRDPDLVSLRVLSEPHDYGSYYDVGGWAATEVEAAYEALDWLEGDAPTKWDAPARAKLGLFSPEELTHAPDSVR